MSLLFYNNIIVHIRQRNTFLLDNPPARKQLLPVPLPRIPDANKIFYMNSNLPVPGKPENYSLVTLYTYRRRNVFLNDELMSIPETAIKYHQESGHVTVGAYVIMPNHLHMLVAPADWELTEFISNFKAYTGQKTKQAGKFEKRVWRKKFYSNEVAGAEDYMMKMRKIHLNPVRKRLAGHAEEYRWSSAFREE